MSSLVKASIWLTISELIFNLSGYVVHSLLGRFLGPADYGRYALVIALSTMIVVLIGRGVPISMSKYLSEVKESNPEEIPLIRKVGMMLQLSIIVLITTIYFFLSPVFARLLGDQTLTPLFRISSLIIPTFSLATFYVYYFTGIHLFEKQALLKFFRSIAKILLILILGFFFAVPGAIVGHALAPFIVFLTAYFIDPFRKKSIAAKRTSSYVSWKKMLSFAWPVTLFLIFYEIMISADLYLVKAILGDDKLTGFYNAALTVGRIPFYAFYFLTVILLPKISQTTSSGLEKETKKILSQSMRFMLMLLIPSALLLSAFADSAIRFFYGARYTPGGDALSILAIGVAFLTVFYVLAFVLNGAGSNKVPMWTALVGSIATPLFSVFFIQKYGIGGAALATSISSFLVMLVIVIFAQKKVCTFIDPGALTKYLAASSVIYILAVNFFSQGRFIFILWSIILLSIYLGLLYIMKGVGKEDWLLLRTSLVKRKK